MPPKRSSFKKPALKRPLDTTPLEHIDSLICHKRRNVSVIQAETPNPAPAMSYLRAIPSANPLAITLSNRQSFEQPMSSTIRKRRSVSVTFAENVAPANPAANLPADPPNCLAEVNEDENMENQTLMNMVPETILSSWTHDRDFRERNKSLRQIYEDEGLDYDNAVSAAELNSRTSNAVKLRQASVAKMFKVLSKSRNVQLCFLIDVTGSMILHINGVRDSIFKIVDRLTAAGPGAIAKEVSMAFVGYRDFGYENQFELLPFTENAEDFRQFCSTIQTPRGPKNMLENDMPEDVFGGLEKAICDLKWSDSMCTKIIFHIADHPCHGRKYQAASYIDKYNDNFPDGDPNGRTAENLFSALREKNIQYHFGRIYWTTDKMIELFSEAMGSEIEVFDVKEIEKLVDCVVSSVSIATSVIPAMRAKKFAFKIDKAAPDWLERPIVNGVLFSYEMPESVIEITSGVPMTLRCPKKARIQIADHPFGRGGERKVFYGRDLSGNRLTDIVLKEYIAKSADTSTSRSPYQMATQMQTIAAYLASVFTDCLAKKNLQKEQLELRIKFLKVQMLSIEINPGEIRYMSCERRYGKDTKFLRFSDNLGYEMLESTCKINNLNFEVVELLMAFSHWSYQITDGYLMVVDLEGVLSMAESGGKILELTDPAIHCKDLTRFGRTNLGEEGMKIFFARHKCNKFCQGMELEKHEATTS
ncbi:alpha-kinase family domain-containing protein [Ditylenchus destructor]|uniref:Alpha-kinase family domain-containing protein n=1 Tax=Ditylenchus destructor TaxID=166010 RepID=A0AAD4MNZ4_9BILA|nr:alpha-kinase family domain-containing protein [Ditylenchus destructor]